MHSAFNRRLFNDWQVVKILERLAGEERKELRHRFARHIVLGLRGAFGEFRAYSPNTRGAAQAMLDEFGDDVELEARLQTVIAEGDEKARENTEQQQRQETARVDVLSKMK